MAPRGVGRTAERTVAVHFWRPTKTLGAPWSKRRFPNSTERPDLDILRAVSLSAGQEVFSLYQTPLPTETTKATKTKQPRNNAGVKEALQE